MSLQLQRDIEYDFDQPLEEVVKGFADDGYSIAAAADILDYPETSFRRLVGSKGWRHWFDKPGPEPEPEKDRDKPSDNPDVGGAVFSHSVTFDGFTGSLKQHAYRLGLNYHTVRTRHRNHPGDLDYVFSKSDHLHRSGNRR